MILQERIPPFVHVLTIYPNFDRGVDKALIVLNCAGIGVEECTVSEIKGKRILKLYSEDSVKIDRLYKLFRKLKLTDIKVSRSFLKPDDWLTRWKIHWKPARLTKMLDVVPVWCKDKYRVRKGRDYILMDTLLSFGTGLHETTQIVSQFIEDHSGKINSLMDIGTGTGILAMVALKHGAKKVLALDIGELSVQAAKDNMRVNKLNAVIKKADIKIFRHKDQFDFVAANLITHDLIEHGQKISGFVKEGGYLAVSGISLDNLPKLRKSFTRLPLKFLAIQQGKQWAGLLYQKKML